MRVRGRSKAARRTAAGAALVALLGVGAFVVAHVWPAVSESQRRVRLALHFRSESAAEAHARFRGALYDDALDRIRRTIPPGDAYLLVDSGGGEDNWARYDLAPRKAVFVGHLKDRMTDPAFAKPPPDAPRWVVVARREKPGPEIFDTSEFFARVRTR